MGHAKYDFWRTALSMVKYLPPEAVYASANSLDICRQELQEVLEGWIVPGLRIGHPLPVIDGKHIAAESETR